MINKPWWRDSVIYQVYPRSFCDTNGDGVGDLRGVLAHLDDLHALGVDVVWLNPVFRSPMRDNGYDVSDYYHVAEQFGTDEDLDALIREAGERGIRILLDLVVNHCSSEHPWFQRALAEPDSEEAGYFYFARHEGKSPPNNWGSNFSGPAWTPVGDGRWYLHTFSPGQPDLNWENPLLREQIYQMVNWWLDRGVAGFRVDAITFIKKDTTFSDHFPVDNSGRYPIDKLENRPGIGDFLSELRDRCFAPHNCLTVAEAPGVPYEQFPDYAGNGGYFSMMMDFSYPDMNQHLPGWSAEEFRARLYRSQLEAQNRCWCALFLESHDQPRLSEKYIPPEALARYGDRPKKLFAALYFLLRGTPIIYQGQEIGMENAPFASIDDFRDVSAIGQYRARIDLGEDPEQALAFLRHTGRDNSRTPMQWTEQENAGFAPPGVQPWILLHPGSAKRNVRLQRQDPDSLWSFYRKLIDLRKSEPYQELFAQGDFSPAASQPDGVVAYLRAFQQRRCLVVCNLSGKEVPFSLPQGAWKVLLDNAAAPDVSCGQLRLAPWEAAVLAAD